MPTRRRLAGLALAVAHGVVVLGCSDDDGIAASDTDSDDAGDIGTADTGDLPLPSAEELFELGAYAVGFSQTEITYADVVTGQSRTLGLRLWYPAHDAGEPTARYALGGLVDIPSGIALADPAPLGDAVPFPVAIYSHGSGGEGLVAYPYAEHLASHGWLVAAPDHTGNTAVDSLAETTVPIGRIALDRPADVSAVLDWLQDSDAHSAQGLGDTDAVLVFGHSFGAYTTLATAGARLDFEAMRASCNPMQSDCSVFDDPDLQRAYDEQAADPRVIAVVPQAPALVGQLFAPSLSDLAVPVMLQSARRDITTPHETQALVAWEALEGTEDLWVELPDGGHLSFITSCEDLSMALLEAFRPTAYEDGCGPDFTDVWQAVDALTAYLDGFARVHVLGESQWSPVLRGDPLDPAVVVTDR